jgi:hypothetical protein
MADTNLSPARVLLLAVQLSINADIATLRKLVSQNTRILRAEVILRILLTYLPESLEPSEYVPFLLDLASGDIWSEDKSLINASVLGDITDVAANKKAKKLHLLPLLWPTVRSSLFLSLTSKTYLQWSLCCLFTKSTPGSPRCSRRPCHPLPDPPSLQNR